MPSLRSAEPYRRVGTERQRHCLLRKGGGEEVPKLLALSVRLLHKTLKNCSFAGNRRQLRPKLRGVWLWFSTARFFFLYFLSSSSRRFEETKGIAALFLPRAALHQLAARGDGHRPPSVNRLLQ